jgi:hypothetical protein
MGTYSPDPEIAELRQRWLARERALRACASALPVDEHGNLLQKLDERESLQEPAADTIAVIERIDENRRRLGRVASPREVWQAGVELTQADRSALAGAAHLAAQYGDSGQERFSALIAHVIASTYLHEGQRAAAITIAAAPPDTVRNMFWADYEYFHASVPPNIEWPSDTELRAGALRHVGDGLRSGLTTPRVEPLASRLERASRVNRCKEKTFEMLADLHACGACTIYPDVRVKGISIDFLTLTWKGVFLIWSVDHRWTTRQAAMVMPVRDQIQRELGEGWPGQVEAIFHSPRESTGWDRRVMVADESDQPIDIVIMGGRIDQLLREWQPVSQVGVDPEWLSWISQAAEPRWWRSEEGRRDLAAPPPHEQL